MPMPVPRAYVVGTCDTKLEELRYIRDALERCDVQTLLVDVGVRAVSGDDIDIRSDEVAQHHPAGIDAAIRQHDRGRAVTAMAEAFRRFVMSRGDIAGMIGVGGSGGSAIITPAMRTLKLGTPRVMVSTMASGNTRPYVEATDILMLYPITDLLGINSISARVLANAAHALAGMISRSAPLPMPAGPAVGFTMFGVTTPVVTQVVNSLRGCHDCLVFHATGLGGETMEALVDEGRIRAVVDLTTTEVADLVAGGHQPAHRDRFGAIARTGVPYVGSCGALDMVNFGAPPTVPECYRNRRLHAHNANVTLMRTTPAESAEIGEWIGAKLNACHGQVRFLLPLGGVSAIDAPGEVFHDPVADDALFAALRRTVRLTARRQVVDVPHHINDAAFSAAVLHHFSMIAYS